MKLIIIIIFSFYIFFIYTENCPNFDNNYNCIDENQYAYPDSWDERCFQTPPRKDIYNKYKPSFQDMHFLVGYAQLKYAPDKKSCTITFITKVNPILGIENEDYKIFYKFGESEQENNIITISSSISYPEGMPISAHIYDMQNKHLVQLILENEYFIWEHPNINLPENIYEKGQKGVIVELYGWPYDDIAEECEFLGYAGYMGVKVMPPNESILTYRNTYDGELNPLGYIFESVSYKLESRMGNKKQLNNMINKCRKHGVRVYAEIVINHMCTNGNDIYEKHINNDCTTWGAVDGSAGSPFWTMKGLNKKNPYTNLPPVFEFPAVPYFASDFHCKGKDHLNYGWLYDLVDLNSEKEYVQQRIADFLTELISIGFSGFDINSGCSLFPKHYAAIFKKLKINLGNEELPNDFITYLQLNMWEGWHKTVYICESENEYNFAFNFTKTMREEGLNDNEINKVKLWNSGFFENNFPICDGNWAIPPERFVIGWVNNYVQRPEAYDIYMTDKNLIEHKNKYAQLLKDKSQNWKIKLVYSSYTRMNNGAYGFPDGKSDCQKCVTEQCKKDCIKSVPYKKAYKPISTGYDSGDAKTWKEGAYTRIHRNFDIVNGMREWMGLNKFQNEDELFKNEKIKSECEKGCLICDEESKKEDLCIFCDIDEGYYPLYYDNITRKYHQCFNIYINYEKIFFDRESECFRPCYDSCKTCKKKGNADFHNCLTCEKNYLFRENDKDLPKNNCVFNCTFPYYTTTDGQYRCSKNNQCVTEKNILIKEKNKCIDDCKNDDIYKYQYNGNCVQKCPDNTNNDNFICIEKNNDNCKIYGSEIELKDFNYDNESISNLIKAYNKEYYYTNKQVVKYTNINYDFIIYRSIDCIDELSLEIPKADFGDCYENVKKNYSIYSDLTIITYNEYIDSNHITTHSFYNPKTSEKLDVESICQNLTITVEEKVDKILKTNKVNYEALLFLLNQNIDIFNPSDAFYTDICYDFVSPFEKDLTLKDRLLTIFPNITLCENGCENKGINLTEMKAQCTCKFHDIVNNKIFKENVLINSVTDEILQLITQNNLEVLKCYKYSFKYFRRSYGGIIGLFFIFLQVGLSAIFYFYDLSNIKKFTFILVDKYFEYLSNNSNLTFVKGEKEENAPPKKQIRKKKSKESCKFSRNIILNFNINNNSNNNANNNDINSNTNVNINPKTGINSNKNSPIMSKKISNKLIMQSRRKTSKDLANKRNKCSKTIDKEAEKFKKIKIDFNEYLEPSLNIMDFEDALKKDKRKFCLSVWELIKDNQMIANALFIKDYLNPRSIKIMMLALNLFLYFIINGLFFNEDYISQVYHIEKEESFFDFFPRSIQRIIYTSIVTIFINIFVECFIIDEDKLKRIFLREKENELNLKYEVTLLLKNMSKRLLAFIIVTFIVYLFFLFYLVCFNYVYFYSQIEWIKSSVTIIIIMQFLSILSNIFQASLRSMSFYFKSEKIYKMSKLLN